MDGLTLAEQVRVASLLPSDQPTQDRDMASNLNHLAWNERACMDGLTLAEQVRVLPSRRLLRCQPLQRGRSRSCLPPERTPPFAKLAQDSEGPSLYLGLGSSHYSVVAPGAVSNMSVTDQPPLPSSLRIQKGTKLIPEVKRSSSISGRVHGFTRRRTELLRFSLPL